MPISRPYAYQCLTPANIDRMKDILRMFAEAFEDAASYQSAVPSDDYLESLLAKEHFIALAAVTGNEVVGGLTAYVLDKFEQDRREVYIYDLAVLEAHRRRGIATGLIEALRRIAATRDAYVIFVQADMVDGPAIALYESLGTQETAHHFDIAVHLPPRKS
jgi:aminoglycoside 3-N-acetyltransferase I